MRVTVCFLSALFLFGCTGVDLAPQSVSNVDFSGTWLIDFGDSDSAPDLRDQGKRELYRRARSPVSREALRLGDGSGLTFIAHDFQVLSADKVDIEQSRDSMGIRYYPGIYRDISWGDRQRGLWEVEAGWEENELVVISTAKDLRVVERFVWTSQDRMRVNVAIDADGEDMAFARSFYRQP